MVAEYLSVSERTVDHWAEDGTIPKPKISPSSRLKRWDRNEIDERLDTSGRCVSGSMSADALLQAHINRRGQC